MKGSEKLERLNEFILGSDLDFKRMSHEEVRHYLASKNLDADRVFSDVKDRLVRMRKDPQVLK